MESRQGLVNTLQTIPVSLFFCHLSTKQREEKTRLDFFFLKENFNSHCSEWHTSVRRATGDSLNKKFTVSANSLTQSLTYSLLRQDKIMCTSQRKKKKKNCRG